MPAFLEWWSDIDHMDARQRVLVARILYGYGVCPSAMCTDGIHTECTMTKCACDCHLTALQYKIIHGVERI